MKKVLFIDRDGTLVHEPNDEQLDSFEKLEYLEGVFNFMAKIAKETTYELVMVTNQDGLGTNSFPEKDFWPVQNFIIQSFENEGVFFSEVHIDRSFPSDGLETRKPGTGMLKKYLRGEYDLENSFVIGDRYTDMELAKNLGCQGILIDLKGAALGQGETKSSESELQQNIALKTGRWKEIYSFIKRQDRISKIIRNTSETKIKVSIDLDGRADGVISTGLGFFDHMLEQIAKHGGLYLSVNTVGDLEIDEHHTIEDTAIALGEAFKQALGKKIGIQRYGFCLPMDDVLAQCAIDFGGRSWLEWEVNFQREKIGEMPTEMFYHFFKSFSDAAQCNLNIKAEGENEHHKIEAIFKAFARSINMAKKRDDNSEELPSTKGTL